LLQSPKIDAKFFENGLHELQKLPPIPSVAEKVDLGERFFMLDSFVMLRRHGSNYLEGLSGGRAAKPDPQAEILWDSIDWDPPLRKANRLYDRFAAAVREMERRVKQEKLREIDDQFKSEMRALKTKLKDSPNEVAGRVVGGEMGTIAGDMLLALMV